LIDKKGFSSIEFVLLTATIIIFIVVPLLLYMIEKVVVLIVIDTFKYAVDQSFLSVYRSMDVRELSSGKIEIDRLRYHEAFQALLNQNINPATNPIIKDYKVLSISIVDGQDQTFDTYAAVKFEIRITLQSLVKLFDLNYDYICVWEKELPVDW